MLTFNRSKMPILLQSESSECGLCCVAMVAAFHGKEHDLPDLRRTLGISLRGANLRSLIQIADSMQMSSRAVKAELFALKNLKLPAILHWNLDHFVVLQKASSKSITVYDPAVGIRQFSLSEAGNYFTGVALELALRQDFKPNKTKKKLTLSDFWNNTFGLKGSFLQVFFLSILVQLFVLALPLYMQITVDEVLTKFDKDLLTVLAICFAGVTVIDVVTKTIRGHANLFLVNQLHFNMGNSVLHHLIRLPLGYFEKRHLGDVVSRFGSIKPVQ
ncbi:MAG: cysteine peptidase family C39 domain-containing protein, partial [Pseudomonadota bacterium]